jgi:hypothetical protein
MGTPSPARTTFGCEVVELHDEVLVAVAGDLDIRAVDEFGQRLADATRPGKPLFIDLTAPRSSTAAATGRAAPRRAGCRAPTCR